MRIVSPACTYTGHTNFANHCAVSGPPWIVATTGDDGRVNLWRVEEEKTIKQIVQKLPDTSWKCSLTEKGDLVAAACNDGVVRVWKTESGNLLHILNWKGFDCSFGVCLSGNGNFLVASFFNSATEDGALVRYVLPEDEEPYVQASWRTPLGWNHGSVSISKSAEVVALAGFDGLQLFEGSRGSLLFSFTDVTRDFDVSLSARGRRAAVADRRKIRIFYQTAAGGWRVRNYDGYKSPLSPTCNISEDGKIVIAAIDDGSFRVWSVSQRYPIISLQGHTAPGRGCCISSNGLIAVTAGVDHTVRLWELDDSQKRLLPERLKEDSELDFPILESEHERGSELETDTASDCGNSIHFQKSSNRSQHVSYADEEIKGSLLLHGLQMLINDIIKTLRNR